VDEGGKSVGSARRLTAEITRPLAHFVVHSKLDDVPASARHEARRSLVNWLGCALGGSSHEAVVRALAALAPFSGPPEAGILGRRERLDCLHAALVNGMSAHVLDFDDTHLKTLLHPSVPVASALLALAEGRVVSGPDFLHAFILGVDVECRIANAVYSAHNVNWYITGTAGVFGAAAATGRVLGLNERQMAWAFGIAATQAAGLREMAGTMCKSFVHGRAAQNGMTAALLAARDFTSSDHVIEAPRGFSRVLAHDRDLQTITAGLGETYEIRLNTYKPYACGVVCHPVINGCLDLRDRHSLRPAQVAAIALRVHPLALKLTGIKVPQGGLESKWSIYHSAAIAVCDGAAGEHQYTDGRVHDPVVKQVRERVSVTADATLREDEAHVAITLTDGQILERHIEHAVGSADNPMSDRDLECKFRGLAEGVLPSNRVNALIGKCWALDELADVSELAHLAVP
jgi:2-methylcitrate dehydratase PrpD